MKACVDAQFSSFRESGLRLAMPQCVLLARTWLSSQCMSGRRNQIRWLDQGLYQAQALDNAPPNNLVAHLLRHSRISHTFWYFGLFSTYTYGNTLC